MDEQVRQSNKDASTYVVIFVAVIVVVMVAVFSVL